jgi:hypothetical protein
MSRRRTAALFAVFAAAALIPVPVLSASPTTASRPSISDGQTTEPSASSDPVLAVAPTVTPTPAPNAPASTPSASARPATAPSSGPATPLPARAPATPKHKASPRASVAAAPVASAHVTSAPTASGAASLRGNPGAGSGLPLGATLALAAIAALCLFVTYVVLFGRSRRDLGVRAPEGARAAAKIAQKDAPGAIPAATRRTRIYPSDDPILKAMGLGRDAPTISPPQDDPPTAAGRKVRRVRPPNEPPGTGSRD